MNRFADIEGLSGSAFSDILMGDDADAADIATAGFTGSVLTNVDLIDGLQELLGEGVTQFGSGNIILGGDGSDLIEGRGGDDLIDGDAWLNVRISVRDANDPNVEIGSVDSMRDLIPDDAGGNDQSRPARVVREILPGSGGFDTAVFSGVSSNYAIVFNDDGSISVTDNVGLDGTDRLRNIERLQFDDQSMTFGGFNSDPFGLVTISRRDAGRRADSYGIDRRRDSTPTIPATARSPAPSPTSGSSRRSPGSGDFQDISGSTAAARRRRPAGPSR